MVKRKGTTEEEPKRNKVVRKRKRTVENAVLEFGLRCALLEEQRRCLEGLRRERELEMQKKEMQWQKEKEELERKLKEKELEVEKEREKKRRKQTEREEKGEGEVVGETEEGERNTILPGSDVWSY
mmetsp:Transcript_11812/g.17926  ORF Transcript_11812/g.17926 Transcript_11812/m.17926 type:complete len:126 (-) Transcript_11812:106-483(-)